MTALVNDEIGDNATISTRCNRRTCLVHFRAKEIFSRPERETLDQERPVWKKLWSDRKLQTATLLAYNKVISVGGKESVEPVIRLTCTRDAADQIDWDQVTTDGLKVLCDWTTLVGN